MLGQELVRSQRVRNGIHTIWCVGLAILLAACADDPPLRPAPPRDGQVEATVASFRVVTSPGGSETVEKIAIHDGLIRFPDETSVWRLFDIEHATVTVVDEIDQRVERQSFDEVLVRLRAAARKDASVLIASVRPTDHTESVAGFEADQYMIEIGRGYERELWISRAVLFHSDLFPLRLATESVSDRNMPALRDVIQLFDALDGYPVIDRSRMTLDEQEYAIEKTLIAVADQRVPAAWFELPVWAEQELTRPSGGPPRVSSPPRDRSAPKEGSPPSGSIRTDP